MAFLWFAGKGISAVSGEVSDTIEWCGAEYSLDDLKAALQVLLPPDTPEEQLLAHEYCDPWAPSSWEVYNNNGLMLLKALAACQTAPQVHRKTICITACNMHHP